jgi:hypothetical protein
MFANESQRRSSYLFCAVAVPSDVSQGLRRQLRAVRNKGSSRIHMHDEMRAVRMRAIDVVAAQSALQILAVVTSTSLRRQSTPRHHTLEALISSELAVGSNDVILERSSTAFDDVAFAAHLRRHSNQRIAHIRHENPEHEPLLWLPDIAAWTLGRTDGYRDRADFPNLTIVDV